MAVIWASPLTVCDTCNGDFGTLMYDARIGGLWGNVCHTCFSRFHGQLGTGLGQRYQLMPIANDRKAWFKTGG